MPRIYPKVVVRRDVRNQSARTGKIDLIVIHTTESHNRPGNADLAAIGAWFDNPAAQASAHVCTDADGTSARYVADGAKAWHVASFNSRALGIEQIGQAAQGEWAKAELKETARWCAYWSKKHNIPLRRSNGSSSGVTRHMDLGAAGGGHHDPGPSYPIDYVLKKAQSYRRLMFRKGVER
jgi:N-acetyl-anhydromuramyl-L-alanine amidase AmpD